MTQVGYVRFISAEANVDITALLGESQPVLSGGIGGWEEVARPRKQALMTWKGTPLRTLEIEVMFDGWVSGSSMEDSVKLLRRLGEIVPSVSRPPIVQVEGFIINSTGDWIVNDIAFEDGELRGDDGTLLRSVATVSLIEFIPASIANVSNKLDDGSPAYLRTHTIKRGDTADSITRLYAGASATNADITALKKRIKSYNNIRDWRRFLKKNYGKEISIP